MHRVLNRTLKAPPIRGLRSHGKVAFSRLRMGSFCGVFGKRTRASNSHLVRAGRQTHSAAPPEVRERRGLGGLRGRG
jgi:hypothetical protein